MDDHEQRTRAQRQERIRKLNDLLRTTAVGGRILFTPGVMALPPAQLGQVWTAIREFAAFTPDADPHHEHDFGRVNADDHVVFWKIDYYGRDMESGSPDPADPTITVRVLTIMLASEY